MGGWEEMSLLEHSLGDGRPCGRGEGTLSQSAPPQTSPQRFSVRAPFFFTVDDDLLLDGGVRVLCVYCVCV